MCPSRGLHPTGGFAAYVPVRSTCDEPTEGDESGLMASFREWCGLACQRSVVRRGLKCAVVVGAILIAINHGDAIMAGELTVNNYVKMGFTVIVPYVVSVSSSVGAQLHARAQTDPDPPEGPKSSDRD